MRFQLYGVNHLAPNGRGQFVSRSEKMLERFFVKAASFSMPFFLQAPHSCGLLVTASPKAPARPLVVPSEDSSHGGGLAAPLFREGRQTEYAQQSSKKKHMKTTSQKNTKGLVSRSAQLTSDTAPQAQATDKTDSRDGKGNLPPIDTEARKKNRTLPTDKVLALLQQQDRRLWELAEVVGKWVWVAFSEQPAPTVRQTLAQLGFHWNRTRQAWQHPCGQFRLSSAGDPHEKYQAYHPAEVSTN